jgi:hypothetical protein
MDELLRYCPRCGGTDIDHESYGSPGTAICRACQTIFTIVSTTSRPTAGRTTRERKRVTRPER